MDDLYVRLIVAAVVLIIFGLLMFFVRRWERRLLGDELYRKQSLFSSAKGGSPKKKNPLAEAEVYLAYGRKAQAIEILERALSEEPGRQDIQKKLRELNG